MNENATNTSTRKSFLKPVIMLIVIALLGVWAYSHDFAPKTSPKSVDKDAKALPDVKPGISYSYNLSPASSTATLTFKEGALPAGMMLDYESASSACKDGKKDCPKQDFFVVKGTTNIPGDYSFGISLNGAATQKYSLTVLPAPKIVATSTATTTSTKK